MIVFGICDWEFSAIESDFDVSIDIDIGVEGGDIFFIWEDNGGGNRHLLRFPPDWIDKNPDWKQQTQIPLMLRQAIKDSREKEIK